MSLRAFLAAMFGAVSDVFGRPLRGLALLSAIIAIPLLAGAVTAIIVYLVPLIPNLQGQMSLVVDAAKLLASFGSVAVGIVLWPAVSMMIGGAFFDVAAERIEKQRFPAEQPGKPPRFSDGLMHGLSGALPALLLNILCIPLLFIPGVNIVAFLTLNAILMSREYFTLAALRFRPLKEVRALRKRHGGLLFLAGLTVAVLLYFPLLNFIAPLYGAALMVRLNKAAGPAALSSPSSPAA